jgi:hypothetical protein
MSDAPFGAAMTKLRIVAHRFGAGDRNWPLNDLQITDVRVVRVALGVGHNPGEGNRRASRIGGVSDLPPTIADSPLRNSSLGCVEEGPRTQHDGGVRLERELRPVELRYQRGPLCGVA